MIVRDALVSDWPAIERLLVACALPLEGAREHLAMFSIGEDGGIVGCAGAEVYGDAALLRSVAVASNTRASGVGAALVTRTLERLKERGVRRVALLTTSAEAYFPRFGFRAVAREELPAALTASRELTSACPASAIAMLLML